MANRAQRRADELRREGQRTRQFSYSKGADNTPDQVRLNFTLRTDTKGQLKNFLECLEAATADVREEIEK